MLQRRIYHSCTILNKVLCDINHLLTNVTKNAFFDLAWILDVILYHITRSLAIHVYFLLFFFLDDSLFSYYYSIFVTSHPGKRSTPRNETFSSVKFSQFSAKRDNKNGSVCSSSDARDLRFSITFCKWLSILENQIGSFQCGRFTAWVSVISDTTASKTSITPYQSNMKHKDKYSQYQVLYFLYLRCPHQHNNVTAFVSPLNWRYCTDIESIWSNDNIA